MQKRNATVAVIGAGVSGLAVLRLGFAAVLGVGIAVGLANYALIRLLRIHCRHDVLHFRPDERSSAPDAKDALQDAQQANALGAPLQRARPFLQPRGRKFQ